MPHYDNLLNAEAEVVRTTVTHISLHTADPGGTGANEATVARQPITWTAPVAGDIEATGPLAFSGGIPSGPVTHVGYWDAATGGTCYGQAALAGDATFSSGGDYTVTALSDAYGPVT